MLQWLGWGVLISGSTGWVHYPSFALSNLMSDFGAAIRTSIFRIKNDSLNAMPLCHHLWRDLLLLERWLEDFKWPVDPPTYSTLHHVSVNRVDLIIQLRRDRT